MSDDDIATYVGYKGYTIYKNNISVEEQQMLRRDLNVKPFVPKSSLIKPQAFPVYRESKKKIYTPRFYGLEVYGEADEMRIEDGKKINLTFKGELRPKQKPVVEKYMKHIKTNHSGLLALHTGFGKCLAKGTSVILSNGKIKKVENIKVGDKLMGDDSTPRTVLSLARGREMMYDIIPTKGEKYTVNESHILSLRCGYSNGNKNYIKDKIIDIEVRDFLKLPKTIKNHLLKGYRVPINFPEKKVDLDPYVLGYWLGDGTCRDPVITTIDEPVIEYFKMYCDELGLYLHQGRGRNNISYRMSFGKKNRKGFSGSKGKNPVLNMLKKHNLIMNKHIPHIYKYNSKSVRLELLAGIIDSDGYYNKGCYDIIQKNETLLDDIIYVARSLGFAAYKKECKKSCMYNGEKKTGIYYRTSIHGEGIEYIPVKLERKKANKRKQIKNVLNTGIKVVKREVDEYFGFEIDGNRRFVLGDFTVTHNTCLALNIISRINQKTLIIVHKEFLLRQWIERIEQFLPDARVGRIQAKTIDTEDKDIVICMLQSLSMKDYPKDMFKEYGLSIYDECFPYITKIQTDKGLINIGSLYEKWNNKEELPKVLSFNREKEKFEYKQMSYAWRKERKDLIKIKMSKRVINCTPEHKILTKNGYIEANKLKVGDLIISKYDKTHIDNIISPGLNDEQLQIIYGSYLGDGHIGITKKNRYRLRIIHCDKQKDYCKWKANMFGIDELKYIEKNGYSHKPAYRFQTKIFDLSNDIPKNTKIVPDWLLDKLDEKGIAIWYMDDGSIIKRKLKDNSFSNYITINSNNFDYDTHIKFVKKFERYGIKCIISKTKGKYYYLRFNKENTLKLLNLIKPYIHKSMHYKINDRNDIYNWSNKFLDYGYLKVTSINYFENKGANRCKKPYVYDIEVKDNHNFVIGTSKKYVDGPVVSNCHHLSAEVFSRAFFKVVTKYGLGLSATMKRKDGLTKILKWFLGPIVCKIERKGEDNVLVKAINYETNDEEFNKVEKDYRGQIKYTTMVKKLCEFNSRSEFILKVLSDLLKKNPKQQIMILGHQKKLLHYLYEAIKHRTIATVGYYIGGMKEEELKKTEGKKVVIATYAMAEEGLDIKTLTTLIMATPKVDVTQSVGRILRKKHNQAIVVDIVDSHSLFQRHFAKRKTFYRKSKFKIEYTNMEGYKNNDWEVIYDPVNKIKKAFKSKFSKSEKKDDLLQGVCLI
jgi:superfamily II DNA or RNA helicase